MQQHYVLGRAWRSWSPEPVLRSLRDAGFGEARIAEVRHWGDSNVAFEVHYAHDRPPIFAEVAELTQDRDVSTSQWEMAEELVNDPEILAAARSLIDVRHYENADPRAVRITLDSLSMEYDGVR